ncbi:MAG: cytidine deaminase [Acidimicrobiia bacterium]|nr:cytidine deaminase [Acidimicrobiia bacterium]MDH3398422.1 cytidine deaminase [Acidimicrobiia bacterium]
MTYSAEELLEAARRVAENAYAPYSDFRVGAVAVGDDGNLYPGVNVENAAYPSGVCAEASAISAAATAGVRRIDVVAVACIDATREDQSYPCGQCRQRLNEFRVDTVIVAGLDGRPRIHSLEELLPFGFRLD